MSGRDVTQVVGFTADADIWCEACATERYGLRATGPGYVKDVNAHVDPVTAIFLSDCEPLQTVCNACHVCLSCGVDVSEVVALEGSAGCECTYSDPRFHAFVAHDGWSECSQCGDDLDEHTDDSTAEMCRILSEPHPGQLALAV